VPEVSLSAQSVAQLFPFHVVFDVQMEVALVSARLSQLCPDIQAGAHFSKVFRLNRPRIKVDFATFKTHGELIFLLESISRPGLVLRGQICHEPTTKQVYFLGSPWVTSVAELVRLGLDLDDYPPHDAVGDMLLLLKTKNTALKDIQELTQKLKRSEKRLKELVQSSSVGKSGTIVFNQYEIVRRIAVGGMGELFLARRFDPDQGHIILKSLLPDLAVDEASITAFIDEAQVLATLHHPNVVDVFAVGQSGGVYYIAMEYIHGHSLFKLLQWHISRMQAIPIAVTVYIIRAVALGLDYIHKAKSSDGTPLHVIHRDVSPQNIMLDGQTRTPKVVDFGIAQAAIRSTATETGVVKGKIRYMPPEQLMGRVLDHRSDQFSLGVVFWEMLAGRHLFDGNVGKRASQEEIADIRTHHPELDRTLANAVMRMLEPKSDLRFSSCADVADELAKILGHVDAKALDEAVSNFIQTIPLEDTGKIGARQLSSSPDYFIPLKNKDQ
jgi:serine/threonine protein kinase